ncbi:hypothetical protein Tco_0020103 [Tanacetum coccineum]
MAVLESRSSSLTNNLVDTITPTPTKPVAYRIPARRKLDKENVKPPVVTGHGHKSQKVSNDYVNFPEFAEALARCRRVQEYVKTKKGGGTKEVVDRTVKNRLGPNSKKVSNKENKKVDVTVKSRLGPNPKRVSNKDIVGRTSVSTAGQAGRGPLLGQGAAPLAGSRGSTPPGVWGSAPKPKRFL